MGWNVKLGSFSHLTKELLDKRIKDRAKFRALSHIQKCLYWHDFWWDYHEKNGYPNQGVKQSEEHKAKKTRTRKERYPEWWKDNKAVRIKMSKKRSKFNYVYTWTEERKKARGIIMKAILNRLEVRARIARASSRRAAFKRGEVPFNVTNERERDNL